MHTPISNKDMCMWRLLATGASKFCKSFSSIFEMWLLCVLNRLCQSVIKYYLIGIHFAHSDYCETSMQSVRGCYSRITSTKYQSFCMTTFSASLTNFTVHLPQSHDCSYYVSSRILSPPPPWRQKHTDLRAQDFANSPDLWHQPRLS